MFKKKFYRFEFLLIIISGSIFIKFMRFHQKLVFVDVNLIELIIRFFVLYYINSLQHFEFENLMVLKKLCLSIFIMPFVDSLRLQSYTIILLVLKEFYPDF